KGRLSCTDLRQFPTLTLLLAGGNRFVSLLCRNGILFFLVSPHTASQSCSQFRILPSLSSPGPLLPPTSPIPLSLSSLSSLPLSTYLLPRFPQVDLQSLG